MCPGYADDGPSLSREQQNKSMGNSIADGMAYSVMAGAGDAYLPAAAVALGASNLYIGLLSALPQLFGALLQFVSLTALRILKNRKLLVMAGAFLHALSWLAIVLVMLWPGELSVPLLIVFFTLGSGLALLANPAWSSWISDIVPDNERAVFFAKRNRLMQLGLFITTFAAGLVLREMQMQYAAAVAFAAVFCIAFGARLSTLFFHSKVSDVKYELQMIREIKLKHLFLLPAHRNELWFLAFIGIFEFAVLFAAPFFTPYMLNDLGFDIGTVGIITALSVLAKVIALPYWGKAINRFGNRSVLIATSFGAALVPVVWLFSRDPLTLGLFNAFSGFVWAGVDLASFNYALSLVGRELRPSFISKYNAFSGVFNAAGAIAGGLFLTGFGSVALFGYSGILLVFLISGVLRFVSTLAFVPKLSSGKGEIPGISEERTMVFNLVAVYPTQGAMNNVLNGLDMTRKIVTSGTLRGGLMIKTGLGATGELLVEGGRKIMSKVSRRRRL